MPDANSASAFIAGGVRAQFTTYQAWARGTSLLLQLGTWTRGAALLLCVGALLAARAIAKYHADVHMPNATFKRAARATITSISAVKLALAVARNLLTIAGKLALLAAHGACNLAMATSHRLLLRGRCTATRISRRVRNVNLATRHADANVTAHEDLPHPPSDAARPPPRPYSPTAPLPYNFSSRAPRAPSSTHAADITAALSFTAPQSSPPVPALFWGEEPPSPPPSPPQPSDIAHPQPPDKSHPLPRPPPKMLIHRFWECARKNEKARHSPPPSPPP